MPNFENTKLNNLGSRLPSELEIQLDKIISSGENETLSDKELETLLLEINK